MAKRVAVEAQLGPVKEYLQGKGFEVIPLGSQGHVDAVVVSGQNENVMGMADITMEAPVVNAEGMTPEQVYQQLANRPTS